MSYVKIGVAGPVGSGKTALIEALTRRMAKDYSIGVITNDIYTKEDAEFLAKNSIMPLERITAWKPEAVLTQPSGRRLHESGGSRRNGGKISGYRAVFHRKRRG